MGKNECLVIDTTFCLQSVVRHGGIAASEIGCKGVPWLIGDAGLFKAEEKVHVDLCVIPKCRRVLLSSYFGEFVLKLVDEVVDGFSRELGEVKHVLFIIQLDFPRSHSIKFNEY